ncbi:MAG: ATP-binding cassette domain-containing protein [Coriobacteriales bacterium]|jgi:NitT/TauT family transport system permease protein|nr:ATP-binding cassette domain-containing protein [Coriobacteriales bacterium]
MKKTLVKIGVIVAWLVIWWLVSLLVASPLLLCSPVDVVITLLGDVGRAFFWQTLLTSLWHILFGFLTGFVVGGALAGFSFKFRPLREFFSPAVSFVKSVPVVCIIVFLLLWSGAPWISFWAGALVVLPMAFINLLQALPGSDPHMVELMRAYRLPRRRRLLAYYWPEVVLPFASAAARLGIGMAWKAGVAAELISLPTHTIGEQIYQAKISLSCSDLLAWTVAIVALSVLCERILVWLLERSGRWSWHLALPKANNHASPPKTSPATQTSSGSGGNTPAPPTTSKPALDFSHIHIQYGERVIIDDLALQLAPGARYALGQPSGSGKSSLVAWIVAHTQQGAPRVSAVFQEQRLFEGRSALENLRLFCGDMLSEQEIANGLIELLPADSLSRPVSQLSGGQRRRVELVRALLACSQLVVLDEPFSGLDAVLQSRAQDFVKHYLGGRSLLIASPRPGDCQPFKPQMIDF